MFFSFMLPLFGENDKDTPGAYDLTPEEQAEADRQEKEENPEGKPPEEGDASKTPKKPEENVEEPEENPEEEPEGDKAKAGLLKDLQGERKKSKALKSNNSVLLQENAFLKGQQASKPVEKEEEEVDPLADIPDDEPLTKAQMKTIVRAEGKKIIDQVGQLTSKGTQQAVDDRWETTREKAAEKYTVETAGEGLDFKSVVERAVEFTEADEVLQQKVLGSKNPAEALYRLGLTHDDSLTLLQAKGAKKITDTINSPKPKTIKGKATIKTGKHSEKTLKALIDDDSITPEDLMKEARDQEA